MQKELKTRQICLFYIAFIPLSKVFIMPSMLAKSAGEDMWISATINLIIDLLTLFFIVLCMKNTRKDFFTLIFDTFGRVGGKILLCFFFFYFMLKGLVPISEQKDYVELTLYTLTPRVFYFLPFFVVALYFCTKNLRAIGRAADVLWIMTAIGFILLFSLSIPNSDFSAILPVGAQGINKILNGSKTTFTWFGDSAYCLFFIGEFVFSKRDGIKILGAQIISGIVVLIFLIIFYAVFTSIAPRQRFALTEISKYSTVINNIGRFDYLGIMLLLFSNLFALTLPAFFASRILNRIFNIKRRWISPLITVGIQLILTLTLKEYLASVESFIMNYGSYFSLIVGNVLPVILSLIFLRREKHANT